MFTIGYKKSDNVINEIKLYNTNSLSQLLPQGRGTLSGNNSFKMGKKIRETETWICLLELS